MSILFNRGKFELKKGKAKVILVDGIPKPTPTPTITPTVTATPSVTPSITASQTQTPTNTQTQTQTPTNTQTQTQTPTPSITASQTQTQTPSPTTICDCYQYEITNYYTTAKTVYYLDCYGRTLQSVSPAGNGLQTYINCAIEGSVYTLDAECGSGQSSDCITWVRANTPCGNSCITPTPTTTQTPTTTPIPATPSNTATQTQTQTTTPTASSGCISCRQYEVTNYYTVSQTVYYVDCSGVESSQSCVGNGLQTYITCAQEGSLYVLVNECGVGETSNCVTWVASDSTCGTICPTATPTNTKTPTQTPTPSITASQTQTQTQTPTPSITASQTQTPTPSITASQTQTQTQTPTPSITASQTQTPTPSITASQTQTPTNTQTATQTPTPSITASQTQTPTPSITASQTQTPTNTQTATQTPTPSITASQTQTPTNTQTATQTPTPSITASQTQTPTNTQTATQTPTPSITASQTQTPTNTQTATQTPTPSITASQTQTQTQTPTPSTTTTLTATPTQTPTPSITASQTQTQTQTPTPSTTTTLTATPTQTPTPSITASQTQTQTQTPTPSTTTTLTATPTQTPTPSITASQTQTQTQTPTPSTTTTLTPTPTQTPTPSITASQTQTQTQTPTPSTTTTLTATPTQTPTPSITASQTQTQTQTPTPSTTTTLTATPTQTPTPSITASQTQTQTQTPTNTATFTPTPTNTPLLSCASCSGTGWEPYSSTQCVRISTAPATAPAFTVSLVSIGFTQYSDFGTRFYDTGYNYNGSGTVLQTNTTNAVWKKTTGLLDGPLNRSGRSGTTIQNFIWYGFSACLTGITTSQTYYVGIGADNEYRLVLDGQEILNTYTPTTSGNTDNFRYWHVYPVQLDAGNHSLELYGMNDPGAGLNPHGFGMEIYNNTLNQLTAATSVNSLNIIWSSSGRTTAEIVQNNAGYYLSSGYTCNYPAVYSVCSGNCVTYEYCYAPGISPTPTRSATPTPTSSATPTSTPTPSTTTTLTATPTQTPTPSTTTTLTATPSQTPTPTQNPVGYGYYTTANYSNATDACRLSELPNSSLYAAPGNTTPSIGMKLYTSVSLSTLFNGQNRYWRLQRGGTIWAVEINTVGEVTAFEDCSTIPTNTPTPTNTQTQTPTPTTPSSVYVTIDNYTPQLMTCSQQYEFAAASDVSVDTSVDVEINWYGDLGGVVTEIVTIPQYGSCNTTSFSSGSRVNCLGEYPSGISVNIDPSSYGNQIYQMGNAYPIGSSPC